MIRLLNAPNQTIYAKNPILYAFQCTVGDVPFGVLGASASVVTNTGFVAGDTLVVDWVEPGMPSKRISFFVGSHNTAVYGLVKHFIYDFTTYQSLYSNTTILKYFQYVAQRIAWHPVLSPFVRVQCIETSNQYKILISAKATSPDWSIRLTDSTVANAHELSYAYVQADARPLHHQFLYQVCVESEYESNQYTALPIQYGTCDADGRVELNISDMIQAYGMSQLSVCPIPNWNDALPQKADNIRRYYLRVTEQYGEPLQTDAWTYCNHPQNPNQVLLGGIPLARWQDWNMVTNIPLQTNQYRMQTVTAEQPNWIPFQDRSGGQRVHLHVHIVHFDGSTSFIRRFQNHGIVTKQWETMLFPASVTALQLDVINLLMYRVTVENADFQFVTPSFTYTIDRQWRYQNAYLCFLNELMMPQIVRFTSVIETRNYERAHHLMPYRPYQDIAQAHESSHETSIWWALEHEKMDIYEFYGCVGLYESNHVFMVSENGFLPVSIQDKELQLPKNGAFTTDWKVTVVPRIESGIEPSDWTTPFSHLLKWRG